MTEGDDGYLVAACHEPAASGQEWAFYFVNNTADPIEELVLRRVGYEWGDFGNTRDVERALGPVAARHFLLAWRDDSDAAEVRVDLTFRARTRRGDETLTFELPKLYRIKEDRAVPVLGKARLAVRPE